MAFKNRLIQAAKSMVTTFLSMSAESDLTITTRSLNLHPSRLARAPKPSCPTRASMHYHHSSSELSKNNRLRIPYCHTANCACSDGNVSIGDFRPKCTLTWATPHWPQPCYWRAHGFHQLFALSFSVSIWADWRTMMFCGGGVWQMSLLGWEAAALEVIAVWCSVGICREEATMGLAFGARYLVRF